jgi:hypothetical protein
MQGLFACFIEIDRHLYASHRLHLASAPIFALDQPDPHARFDLIGPDLVNADKVCGLRRLMVCQGLFLFTRVATANLHVCAILHSLGAAAKAKGAPPVWDA